MGHKPWDRPWKRAAKAREKRRWQREAWWDGQVVGIHLLPDVNADPNVLPPSAAIIAPPTPMADDIEPIAAAVHQAYLDTCERLGWPVKPANQVPYDDLPDDSKELDRASVRAVLEHLSAHVGATLHP